MELKQNTQGVVSGEDEILVSASEVRSGNKSAPPASTNFTSDTSSLMPKKFK